MVLESLITPVYAERHPGIIFLLGAIYATLALFLALWIFEEQSSMVLVFLAASAAIPLIYHTMTYEEKKDLVAAEGTSLIREHSAALVFYLALFLGMAVAFTFWYVIFPSEKASTLFHVQAQTIANLNQHVTGNITQTSLLSKIFLNNIKVTIFCILFSFLYGSGAIFILSWNASVIGVAAGNFIRGHMAAFAAAIGFQKVGAYFYVSSLSILRYSVHGIPEIFAYIIAAFAGGILSAAIIRHDFGTQKFETVLLDVSDLVLLSVFVLFIAAILEVFVTPALF